MTANVLGLDISLTQTGAAKIYVDGPVRTTRYTPPKHPENATLAEDAGRRRSIKRFCITQAGTGTALVIIEELPAMTKFGKHDERAAVVLGVIEHFVHLGVPVATVHPSSLKQRISGDGHADKDTVRRAVAALHPGQGLLRVSDDEADAAAAATLGVARLAAILGLPWTGKWLNAQSLNLESGFRWPVELHTTPAQRPPVPLPMFEVPSR